MEPAAAVIYQEQLLKSFKRGMPLYEPESEVHIGDVGYFCEGRFTRLFNVTRPEGDPWQTEMGVPLGFETLEIPLVHRLAIPNYFLPQPLCSRSVRAKEINVELNAGVIPVGAGIEFTSHKAAGAVLVLRQHMGCENVNDTATVRRYIREHIDNWYDFVRSNGLEYEASEGDLVLVRGCDKTASWALTTFESESTGAGIFFQGGYLLDSSGIQVALRGSWKTAHSHVARESLRVPPSQPEPFITTSRKFLPDVQDQCLFVRVWKIWRLPLRIPPWIRAAGDHSSRSHDRPEGSGSGENRLSSSTRAADIVIELDPSPITVNHPADHVLTYIAENAEVSHAKLAIATDDDVYRFLEDKDIPDDMQAMLLAMMPEIEVDSNGVARLRPVEDKVIDQAAELGVNSAQPISESDQNASQPMSDQAPMNVAEQEKTLSDRTIPSALGEEFGLSPFHFKPRGKAPPAWSTGGKSTPNRPR